MRFGGLCAGTIGLFLRIDREISVCEKENIVGNSEEYVLEA